jgi:hypothetical protein
MKGVLLILNQLPRSAVSLQTGASKASEPREARMPAHAIPAPDEPHPNARRASSFEYLPANADQPPPCIFEPGYGQKLRSSPAKEPLHNNEANEIRPRKNECSDEHMTYGHQIYGEYLGWLGNGKGQRQERED